jgi:hypothetical protein
MVVSSEAATAQAVFFGPRCSRCQAPILSNSIFSSFPSYPFVWPAAEPILSSRPRDPAAFAAVLEGIAELAAEETPAPPLLGALPIAPGASGRHFIVGRSREQHGYVLDHPSGKFQYPQRVLLRSSWVLLLLLVLIAVFVLCFFGSDVNRSEYRNRKKMGIDGRWFGHQ